MPVMGGDSDFQTTRLFAPDCSAARFTGNRGSSGGRSKWSRWQESGLQEIDVSLL
ncbi:hypothetical protein F2Q70_00022952 [Brassica cretica]|uniref:Uncharacterized protein n=2 Tax=Brassica cretica TaxID=69181 RepID=A0A3N6SSC0_BRACR|nr:hypothetical protein F2Q70_00022952 [Brassica cretica]KAF2556709.1 hypothetical protein F2Q68_00017209 [Brassica cretica]KAF3610735.1 hypothetical protein DY000_02049891 [Brassica cretica]